MDFFRKSTAKKNADQKGNLTEGPIAKGLFTFMIPIFLGQLLQQLYNMADAWVVGNYASNDAFAAVSLSGNVTMSVITLFGGIAIGGGVVISKYFGAQDEENLRRAVHTNFLLGIVFSILATIIGQVFVPILLGWLHTPDSVMTEARLWNLFCRRLHGHHVQHLHEHHAGGRGQRTSTLLPDLFLRGEHDPGSHFCRRIQMERSRSRGCDRDRAGTQRSFMPVTHGKGRRGSDDPLEGTALP